MQNVSHFRVLASLQSLHAALIPWMAGSRTQQPGKPIEGAGRLLFLSDGSFQPRVTTLRERRDKGRGRTCLREQSQGPERVTPQTGGAAAASASPGRAKRAADPHLPSHLPSLFFRFTPEPHEGSRISPVFSPFCSRWGVLALQHIAGWRFACLEIEQNFIFQHLQPKQ